MIGNKNADIIRVIKKSGCCCDDKDKPQELNTMVYCDFDTSDPDIMIPVGLCKWNDSTSFEAQDDEIILFPCGVTELIEKEANTFCWLYSEWDDNKAQHMLDLGILSEYFGGGPSRQTYGACEVTYKGKTYYSMQEAG